MVVGQHRMWVRAMVWMALLRARSPPRLSRCRTVWPLLARQWAGVRQRGERGIVSAPSDMGERDDGLGGGDRADAAAIGQSGSHLVGDGLQLGPVVGQRVPPGPHGQGQASDLAVPHRLLAAGKRRLEDAGVKGRRRPDLLE